jgi:hypothetical protein
MIGKMKDKILEKLQSREFSFMQLLKMQDLAVELADEIYDELDIDDKVSLVWQVKITAESEFLGTLFEKAARQQLTQMFIEALQQLAEGASVSFEEKTKKYTPLPTAPVEEKPPIPPKKVKQDDGTDLPKGVKRV